MASLKVWHFIPNPLALSDSFITLSFTDRLNAVGYVEWTGWSLPDTSIIEHAPKEYMAYLRVDYRISNTASWVPHIKTVIYNTEVFNQNNVFMFMPNSIDQSTYSAAFLKGAWSAAPESANNRWKIITSMMAYLSNDSIQSLQNSDVVMLSTMALRGINIYY